MNEEYGLEIRYNNNEPLYCFSSKPGGVGAHLYWPAAGFIELVILVKLAEKYRRYTLKRVLPGDFLSLRYLSRQPDQPSNIRRLKELSRAVSPFTLQLGFKIGFDAELKSGKTVRLSYPEGGVFQFILGNVPRNHARVQIIAANEMEQWQWQLPDLYPNEAITLSVIETDWNDPAPNIERRGDAS